MVQNIVWLYSKDTVQWDHLKVIFSLCLPDFPQVYDLGVRSRPSFRAIMNYVSRDIITQES